MTERVCVVVRVRPFLPTDPADADLTTLIIDDTHVSCGSQRVFRVDKAYKMEDDTDEVYRHSVKGVVADFLAGFNVTVMAYGQTGTGKTHTIAGLFPLIIGQVVHEGFGGRTDELSFQHVEVYGDSLRDLLSDNPAASAKALQIYDGAATVTTAASAGPDGSPSAPPHSQATSGSFVAGATRVSAANIAEVFDILAYGTANRATGATNVHQHSSRSHSVFTVFNHRTRGKLHIVDLAGSERNKKTLNVGQRLQESIAINAGLLALGNVIRALSRRHAGAAAGNSPTSIGAPGSSAATGHIPYRSSKLTRLLQDALGGNGKTILITCVAPDSYNQDETLRSLQYGALAMRVLNAPVKHFTELHRAQIKPYRRGADAGSREGGGGERDGQSPDEAATLADMQRRLEMLQQFCDEQEAEIFAMRDHLADSNARLRVCEAELQKDEVIFTRQIAEMERLVAENKALRRQLSERARIKEEERKGGGASPRGDGNGYPVADGLGVDNGAQGAGAADPLKRTLPYLRKTVHLGESANGLGESEAPEPSAVSPLTGSSLRLTSDSAVHQDPRRLMRDAADVAESGDRDEHMLALTKEALHYQRANTQLRHEVSAARVTIEAQRREAAMLRLELEDLHKLLS